MTPALRALVLDGHSRAAVETVQSLGRRGVLVHVAAETSDCLAFRSAYPALRFRQPSQASVPFFVDWLRELDAEHHYTLIVPATEVSLLGFIGIPRDDPLRERAVLASDDALNIALDKQRTGELASRLRIPVPRSILIRNVDAVAAVESYPMILKPIRSQVLIGEEMTTLSTGVVRDASERRDYLERWLPHGAVLQQEFMPGFGVGIGILYDRGRKVWHFGYERVHELPLTGGASSYRRSVDPDPRLLSVAEQLLSELDWHGVAMVEFRVNGSGQFTLMEINPRLWGSLALAIDAGVDFPRGLLSLASRELPGAQPLYRQSHYTRDVQSDFRWLKANMKADRSDSLLLTRGRVASAFELFRPLTGRESWDHFDWRDLTITGSILASALSDAVKPLESRVRKKTFEWDIGRHHRRVLRALEHAGSLPKRILFLCHGNVCRSPMAARLASVRLAGCQVRSAGLRAQLNGSTPPHFLRAASSLGVDLAASRPSPVTVHDVATADLILLMDVENYREFSKRFPEAAQRTTLLGLFAAQSSLEIKDPYVLTDRDTRAVVQHIAAAVDGLVEWASLRERTAATIPHERTSPRFEPPLPSPGRDLSSTALQVRVHTDESALLALRAEWDELLDKSEQRVFFLRWSWVSLWWHTYAPPQSRLYLLTCRDSNDRLVGLAPLYWHQRSFAGLPHVRELRFLGTSLGSRISEHLDLVTQRGSERACADAFADFLLRRRDWDRLWLWSIPARSAIMQPLQAALGDSAHARLCDHSHRIDTGRGWDGAKQAWSRKFSYNIDRCTRILYKDYAPEFGRVTTPDAVTPALNDLIHLHQIRWHTVGESGSFAYPKFEAFLRSAVPQALQEGRLGFWTLKLRGRSAAALLAFIDGDVAHYFQSGFDMQYAKYSLGSVMVAHAIRACVDAPEIRTFDFMGGDAAYKDSWTHDVREAYELEVCRPGPRTLLYSSGQQTRRALALVRRSWRERFRHGKTAIRLSLR